MSDISVTFINEHALRAIGYCITDQRSAENAMADLRKHLGLDSEITETCSLDEINTQEAFVSTYTSRVMHVTSTAQPPRRARSMNKLRCSRRIAFKNAHRSARIAARKQ